MESGSSTSPPTAGASRSGVWPAGAGFEWAGRAGRSEAAAAAAARWGCSPPSLCLASARCSVVFFTTLVLVGFGLPKQVKAPLVRGKNWCMDKLCCGRRRPVTKLDPPAAPAAVPAADALAEPAVDNAAEAVAATAPAS